MLKIKNYSSLYVRISKGQCNLIDIQTISIFTHQKYASNQSQQTEKYSLKWYAGTSLWLKGNFSNDFAKLPLKETIFGINFFHLNIVHIAILSRNFSNPNNRQIDIILKFLNCLKRKSLEKFYNNNILQKYGLIVM